MSKNDLDDIKKLSGILNEDLGSLVLEAGASLSHRTSGVSSNKDFNLSWAKASQDMRDMQQKMMGSMSAINYNRNKPETDGAAPVIPNITQAPAGAPDKASSGPATALKPNDTLNNIKAAVQKYTPGPVATAIKSADAATGGKLGDVGGALVKGIGSAANVAGSAASKGIQGIAGFGDKLRGLLGMKPDPLKPQGEATEMEDKSLEELLKLSGRSEQIVTEKEIIVKDEGELEADGDEEIESIDKPVIRTKDRMHNEAEINESPMQDSLALLKKFAGI